VVRRGRQFGDLGVPENERKSKGVKQAWAGRFHKEGQRRNHVMLKREHVDGVGGPGRVRAATGIGSKSRLPVGCRRYQAKSAIGLPSPIKEGADHPAPRIPLRQRRHGIGRVVFEEGHKIVQIEPFPGP